MLWAAFLTCFFGFFRSGEVCASQTEGFNPASDLTTDSVTVDSIYNPRQIRIRLQTSKTDPFRERAVITLPRTEDDLCPVTALLAWLVYRGKSLGRYSYTAVGSTSNPYQASQGTQNGTIGTGFRSRALLGPQLQERCCHNGSSDSQIKILGRWRSSAFQRYIHPSRNQVASL